MSTSTHPNSSSRTVPPSTGLIAEPPTPKTIPQLLTESGKRFAIHPALSYHPGCSINYDELNRIVAENERKLIRLGLSRQDRVAVVLPSPLESYLAFLSVSSCAVFCPFNPDYTESEFEHFFEAIGTRYLITNPDQSSVASSVAARMGMSLIKLTADATRGLIFDDHETDTNTDASQSNRTNPQDIALILHTSGTTSASKIAPLTHANLMASASNMAVSLSLTAQDCCLNILPPFHVGALVDLLLAPLLSGGSVVVSGNPEPESVFAHLHKFQPSWFQAVPTMLNALLRHRSATVAGYLSEASQKRLRLIRSVSAPLPGQWLRELESYLSVPVIEIYGMTETAGLICSNPLETRKEGSVGKPVGQQVAIVNAEGNHAAPGKIGEVVANGENVFTGYEATGDAAKVNHEAFFGSWFRTGDEGYLDDEGYLFLTGRIKEIINRGGEKISPQEVDRVALEHPDVRDAGSFAIQHESLGEDIAMAVVPENGRLDLKSLKEHLSGKLAYYKVPRHVHILESLPRNRSGKLQRHKLSDQFGDPPPAPTPEQPAAPTSQLALTISRAWASALNVKHVGMNDNFFDLGGDSLSAKGMLAALQKELGFDIHVAALFDHSTLAEFESYLAKTLAEGRTTSTVMVRERPNELPEEVYQQLVAYLSGWRGGRQNENSLLVGLNTMGDRPPLFWCVQGFDELKRLSEVLGNHQPVYGMRSLLNIEGHRKEQNTALARLYAAEIRNIRPEGGIFVGGLCEGGKIAFAIAEEMNQIGRSVSLLCLHEQFIPKVYAGCVALFYGRPNKFNPYGQFNEPEKGWRQFYKGTVSLHRSDMIHEYSDPLLAEFGQQLLYEMDCAIANKRSSKTLELAQIANTVMPETAYQAEVSVEDSIPRILSPGESLTLQVRIRNLSPNPWPPSQESGIVLSSRWFNRHGTSRSTFDGRSTFDTPIMPGESVALSLTVTATKKTGSRVLVIDLADEGVTWFQDRGGEPCRAALRVIPGAKYFSWMFGNSNGRPRINHG